MSIELSGGNMDAMTLIMMIAVSLTVLAVIVIAISEGFVRVARTLILSIARVKVEKYRAMGRANGVQGE